MRAQNKEIVSRTVGRDGQEALVVVELLKEKGATTAWAYLVFDLPAAGQFMMTSADRWIETARLVVSIAVVLLMAAWWSLRSSTASIRKDIAQALIGVQEGTAAGASTVV